MNSVAVPILSSEAGKNLPPHCVLERRIVANLIAHLAASGWVPIKCDDGGDEDIACNDVASAMEVIFSVDESKLVVAKPDCRNKCIVLICGNGIDIISDHSYVVGDPDGFSAAMDAFDAEAFV